MEFLELSLVCIASYLILKKPEKEDLAFGTLAFAWLIGALIYVGHISDHILPNMSL